MLTWSNWKTEPRGNRYHYASRFARHLPVYFVQPDERGADRQDSVQTEPTELAGVTLWHVGESLQGRDGLDQKRVLDGALAAAGAKRPLIWVYNTFFEPYVQRCDGHFRVFHATEDYYATDIFKHPELFRDQIRRLQGAVNLLVAVSEPVAESYRRRGGHSGPLLTLTNGCDFGFLAENPAGAAPPADRPVAIYQGSINNRLDFPLLDALAARMPDWDFVYCGRADESLPGWRTLQARPNVKYLGYLVPEQIRDRLYAAHVGLLPYLRMPNIDRAVPLKAFEYLAAGLPVAGIPMAALVEFGVFRFADGAAEFEALLRELAPTRGDPAHTAERRAAAKKMDYDENFRRLGACLEETLPTFSAMTKNILVLYDDAAAADSTVRERLLALRQNSRHEVYFAPAVGEYPCPIDLDVFDAVIVDESAAELSAGYRSALERCRRPRAHRGDLTGGLDAFADAQPQASPPRRLVTAVVGSVDAAAYHSFRHAAPARLLPSTELQERRQDAVERTEDVPRGEVGLPPLTETYPNVVPIVKMMDVRTLLRFAAANLARRIFLQRRPPSR